MDPANETNTAANPAHMEREADETCQDLRENERTCIICNQTKPLQEGITLISEFICSACEAEIVQTDVKDEKYPFFIHQMKQIWFRQNA